MLDALRKVTPDSSIIYALKKPCNCTDLTLDLVKTYAIIIAKQLTGFRVSKTRKSLEVSALQSFAHQKVRPVSIAAGAVREYPLQLTNYRFAFPETLCARMETGLDPSRWRGESEDRTFALGDKA